MSRITKLPMPSKENRGGGPALRPTTKTVISRALSDDDKRALLKDHTRPLLRNNSNSATTASTNSMTANSVTSNSVASWKNRPNTRAVTAPSTFAAKRAGVLPPKPKEEPPKPKAPPKITSKFDYKGRFENLLEKHKSTRSELDQLKLYQEELSDECETLRNAASVSDADLSTTKERLEQILGELSELKKKHEQVTSALETERASCEQLRRQTEVLNELARGLEAKSREYDRLEEEHSNLKRAHESLKSEVEALRTLTAHLKRDQIAYEALKLEHKQVMEQAASSRAEAEALQNMLAAMHKEQRDLRNMVQDLKGNIRVYCRVRPPLANEVDKPLYNVHFLDSCSMELEKVELNAASASTRKGARQSQAFTFDGILTPHANQEDVFAEVAPVIQSALDGYNVCIFAYGQTGSGKTYTMEGGAGEARHGIIPRAFKMMFETAESLKRMGWELSIVASFLEIYNESIYDLLDPNKDQEQHEIRMSDARGADVYVTNLKEVEVRSAHDFVRHMMSAQRNRATAATVNNERSSRSHAVTRVRIAAVNATRKERLTSHLNLVDLAGSESGKTSTTARMAETCNINKSLSELKNVILALRGNAAHVPYRNSKLTYLLMPSLGGNSKALMLVNVCQLDECFAETVNTLRFALQVNTCRTVKAKKNITLVDM